MQKQEEEEVLKCFQNVYSLYALNNVQSCNLTYRHYGDCMQTEVPIRTFPYYPQRTTMKLCSMLKFPRTFQQYLHFVTTDVRCHMSCPHANSYVMTLCCKETQVQSAVKLALRSSTNCRPLCQTLSFQEYYDILKKPQMI